MGFKSKNFKLMLVTIFLVLFCISIHAQNIINKTRLLEVKKIFVDNFADNENAEEIKEKIKLRLLKTGRFIVVERPENADAILTGIGGVRSKQYSSITTDTATGNISGEQKTIERGFGAFRLVDIKSEETIWVFEYKRGLKTFGFNSQAAKVADRTVGQLLEDIKKAEKEDKPK